MSGKIEIYSNKVAAETRRDSKMPNATMQHFDNGVEVYDYANGDYSGVSTNEIWVVLIW